MITVYSVALGAGLLASGTWLARKGRKVGFFFGLVGVLGLARVAGLL